MWMYNDWYLQHSGTKRHSGRYPYGSGDRPYQRENRGRGGGNRSHGNTPASNNSETKAFNKANGVGKWFAPAINAGKGMPRMSPAEKITRESRNIVSNSEDLLRAIQRANRSSGEDLSHLTDKELRDAVNRMELEKRYSQLSREKIRTGYDYAYDVLDILGPALGVASSAATIGGVIYLMKAG